MSQMSSLFAIFDDWKTQINSSNLDFDLQAPLSALVGVPVSWRGTYFPQDFYNEVLLLFRDRAACGLYLENFFSPGLCQYFLCHSRGIENTAIGIYDKIWLLLSKDWSS